MSAPSQQRSAGPLTLPPLEEASLESRLFDAPDLDSFLMEFRRLNGSSGGEWNGIAYSTAGASPVTGVDAEGELIVGAGGFQKASVYELRLWAIPSAEVEVLAHELRWLNGSGGAEIIVSAPYSGSKGTGPSGDPAATAFSRRCWYRENAYLQHLPLERREASDGDASAPPTMTSLELFCEEEEFSNVAFVDELMTGRWDQV